MNKLLKPYTKIVHPLPEVTRLFYLEMKNSTMQLRETVQNKTLNIEMKKKKSYKVIQTISKVESRNHI